MQSITTEFEVWNAAGCLNLRDHQMLLFILHKQTMTGESGIASGTIVMVLQSFFQMHTLHDMTRLTHGFTHAHLC